MRSSHTKHKLLGVLLTLMLIDSSDAQAPNTSKEPTNTSLTKGMNVLFVAIDDLNDWVGCIGGNPQAQTPNMDAFFSQGGMVMHDAHCASTVCGPSRSSLLTGVHCHKTGVYGNNTNLKDAPKASELVTLPEYFSRHGYHSLSMGKIFHKHGTDIPGKMDEGEWAFDEWHPSLPTTGAATKDKPANGLLGLDGKRAKGKGAVFDWGPSKGNDETQMQDHKTATWASRQLRTRDFDTKPFFMAIGFSKPHLPFYVPQKYYDKYPLDSIVLPETLRTDHDDIVDSKGRPLYGEGKPRTDVNDWWARTDKYGKHREAVQAYLATVSFVDDCIGVLLDGLNQSKHADNTIVVLFGDHGWHLGEKLRYGKTLLWQESTRVPMQIKVPGVTPASKQCNGVVNLIDLYPTLVDLCGLPANNSNDGRSFADLLHQPDLRWNEPTLTTYQMGNHRIYDGRYSYINYRGGEELYDHKTDPMEWTNLAHVAEYNAIKKRLIQHLPQTNEPPSMVNPFDENKKSAKKRGI